MLFAVSFHLEFSYRRRSLNFQLGDRGLWVLGTGSQSVSHGHVPPGQQIASLLKPQRCVIRSTNTHFCTNHSSEYFILNSSSKPHAFQHSYFWYLCLQGFYFLKAVFIIPLALPCNLWLNPLLRHPWMVLYHRRPPSPILSLELRLSASKVSPTLTLAQYWQSSAPPCLKKVIYLLDLGYTR